MKKEENKANTFEMKLPVHTKKEFKIEGLHFRKAKESDMNDIDFVTHDWAIDDLYIVEVRFPLGTLMVRINSWVPGFDMNKYSFCEAFGLDDYFSDTNKDYVIEFKKEWAKHYTDEDFEYLIYLMEEICRNYVPMIIEQEHAAMEKLYAKKGMSVEFLDPRLFMR